MKDVKYKKIKLSPHTRDKVGLFARDYDKDLYVEFNNYDVSVFETKAYPEKDESYHYFKFNQNDRFEENITESREAEIKKMESLEEKRMEEDKYIAEKIALEKAQEAKMKKNK